MEEMTERTDLDREAAELEALALRLSMSMRRGLQQYLELFNLTLPQYTVLNVLHREGRGCSMSELADASHQLSPTMTGIVDRLMERGFVTRERDEKDRRALRVELTPEGRALVARIKEHKRGWMRRFLQVISPEERAMINAVLLHFLAVIEDLPIMAEEPVLGV